MEILLPGQKWISQVSSSAERHGFEPVLHTTFIDTIYLLPWAFIMLFYQLILLICKFFIKKVTIIP